MPSKLIILDNFFSSSPKNLQAISSVKSVEIIKDDARDLAILQNIIESHRIEIVFNCATQALNYSFINPKSAFDVNTKIALKPLELQRRGMFKTLCHFSTSEVYGTANSQKIKEDHPLKPTTPYAAGKLADMAVLSYFQTFGLDCIILRPLTILAQDRTINHLSLQLFLCLFREFLQTNHLKFKVMECKAVISFLWKIPPL